jgi:hypothetical protein
MKAKRNGTPLQVYDGQKLIGEVEDFGRGNVTAHKFEGAARVNLTSPTGRDFFDFRGV